MKKVLAISVLSAAMGLGSGLAFAQGPASDPNTTTTRYDDSRHNNWGWLGLLGLIGLAGLVGRKSETAERLQRQGVNVKSV